MMLTEDIDFLGDAYCRRLYMFIILTPNYNYYDCKINNTSQFRGSTKVLVLNLLILVFSEDLFISFLTGDSSPSRPFTRFICDTRPAYCCSGALFELEREQWVYTKYNKG